MLAMYTNWKIPLVANTTNVSKPKPPWATPEAPTLGSAGVSPKRNHGWPHAGYDVI